MEIIDYIIIALFLLVSLGLGLYHTKKASKGMESYFLGNRSNSWWIVGISITAAFFASDTPLALSETVRGVSGGFHVNWFWWGGMLQMTLTVFVFSRFWRRANVLSDNEFIEIRYSGKPAAFLRGFKAFYFSTIYNIIVLGWVINGMVTVLRYLYPKSFLETPFDIGILTMTGDQMIISGLFILVVVYVLSSGLMGVLITNLMQFGVAMFGAIALMVIVMFNAGSMEKVSDIIRESHYYRIVLPQEDYPDAYTHPEKFEGENELFLKGDICRDFVTEDGIEHGEMNANLKMAYDDAKKEWFYDARLYVVDSAKYNYYFKLNGQKSKTYQAIIYNDDGVYKEKETHSGYMSTEPNETLSIVPEVDFSLSSPFMQMIFVVFVLWWCNHVSDGGGFFTQQFSSTKDEKNGMFAALWFTILHYVIRMWPWLVVAAVSIIYMPNMTESKAAYPNMISHFMPVGLKGLMVASFLAAFMSTVSTHLNWGGSYMANDLWKRFVQPGRSEHHYITVSRIYQALLALVAVVYSFFVSSIFDLWVFVYMMSSGLGSVIIMRWFFWRINAWSEISALLSSFLIAFFFSVPGESPLFPGLYNVVAHFFGVERLGITHQFIIITFPSIICWLTVTFFTEPEKDEVLKTFYKRVQPGGWWKPIIKDIKGLDPKKGITKITIKAWVFGSLMIYSAMFGLGYLFFASYLKAVVLLILAAYLTYKMINYIKLMEVVD